MAVDNTKNACKYSTFDVKSESNCFNFSWKFMKYSMLATDKEHEIAPFKPKPVRDLKLIIRKYDETMYFSVKCEQNLRIKSDISIAIFDDNGEEMYSKNYLGISLSAEIFYLIYHIDSKTHNHLNSSPNDTLTFYVEFRIENVVTWKTYEEQALNYCKTETKLLVDLKKFILEKHPTKIVLKTKDSQTEVNKAILCSRSSVFQKMFENPMREQENDTVLIDDVSGSTLEILVDFINTSEADLNIEFSRLKELFYAADKYDVLDLRWMCAANILSLLTNENVCEVLRLAQKHSDERLKKGCLMFIRRRIDFVMGTEGWKDLKTSDPNLAVQIFEFYVKGAVEVE